MKLSKNFYDFDIDLKSNKSKLVGTAEHKNEKYCIRLLSADGKSSIRREIGVAIIFAVLAFNAFVIWRSTK